MVVYPGTNKPANEFSTDADKVNNTVGDPEGFYFTNEWGQASNYSRAAVKKTGEGKFNVQQAFLNLRDPVDATEAWRKNNSEYALNIDFSTVCKKRQVLDFLMNKLIRDGHMEKEHLSPSDVARINQ